MTRTAADVPSETDVSTSREPARPPHARHRVRRGASATSCHPATSARENCRVEVGSNQPFSTGRLLICVTGATTARSPRRFAS